MLAPRVAHQAVPLAAAVARVATLMALPARVMMMIILVRFVLVWMLELGLLSLPVMEALIPATALQASPIAATARLPMAFAAGMTVERITALAPAPISPGLVMAR